MSTAFDRWTRYYREAATSGKEPMWPSETLIRLVRGDYVPNTRRDLAGSMVLDVGCGNGNNIVFLASLGARVHGTEVTDELARATADFLRSHGIDGSIVRGVNTDLPYDDATFDLLVSWNVIHYESDDTDIDRAIAEYHRVLRPGGQVVVSTTGPEHRILEGATRLAPRQYRLGPGAAFRAGEIMYCFEHEENLRSRFERSFQDVRTGRTLDRLMTSTLDWFVLSAVRAVP